MTKRYNTTLEIKAEVVRLLQERLALINVDRDKYMLDGAEDDEKHAVTVIYDGIKMMTVRAFISNVVENGKHQVRGMFSLRAVYDDYWYDNDDLDAHIFVDEFMCCQFQNQLITFERLLDILLPLADEGKVKRINDELEKICFKDAMVKYDTFTYKYVVEGDIHSFLFEESNEQAPAVRLRDHFLHPAGKGMRRLRAPASRLARDRKVLWPDAPQHLLPADREPHRHLAPFRHLRFRRDAPALRRGPSAAAQQRHRHQHRQDSFHVSPLLFR